MIFARPPIFCLCGSTKFREEFIEINKLLTNAGVIVLTVGSFGHADGVTHTVEKKAQLDVLHLRKIMISDKIVVINKDQYIGESTAREIEFAVSCGLTAVYWWNDKGVELHRDVRSWGRVFPGEKENDF